MSGSQQRAARLASMFRQNGPNVFAYCLRHCGHAGADDLVAEVFMVAWRRVDEVPDPPLPWLLVVARNLIRNRLRGQRREQRALAGLTDLHRVLTHEPAADQLVVDRDRMLHALAELTPTEREAALLVGWHGLTPRQAALVADCSPATFEVRLHRARVRLRRVLNQTATGPTSAISLQVQEGSP